MIKKYQDTKQTNFKTNKESYKIKIEEIANSSSIKVFMAAGGGFCAKVVKQ